MKTEQQNTPPAYQVTPLDNFDWYEGAGVPTKCRDAEHAISVAMGIIERSLSHERNQAKNPSDPNEVFSRWDDFGDYPSIYPAPTPPFDPTEYAKRRAEEICTANSLNDVACITENNNAEQQDADEFCEDDEEGNGNDPNCYAFYCEDSYPVSQLIDGIRDVMARPDVADEALDQLKVFLFAMKRLPLVTPGVRMSLSLRLDQGGEANWIEIRMEDEIFTLTRGAWVDGDAETETHFEVGLDCRDGDALQASNFALSFISCAEDVCREVVIEDTSDEPFNSWSLEPDKKRWSQLPSSFF